MKYFTRELIEMGQARDDAILHRQSELWDEACARYFNQLDTLKNAMPAGLRQRVDNYYLHDAVIRGMGRAAVRSSSCFSWIRRRSPC